MPAAARTPAKPKLKAAPVPRSAKASAIADDRAALCLELVTIHKKHSAVFDRIEAIKSALKTIATDAGENFKETIPDKGTVSVASAKDKKLKGMLPVIQQEVWLTLPPKEQNELFKSGLVLNEQQWSGAYYGAVTVTLF